MLCAKYRVTAVAAQRKAAAVRGIQKQQLASRAATSGSGSAEQEKLTFEIV